MKSQKDTHTPLMKQYHDIKAEFPDTLLLFQVGEFYELFCDDARRAAAFLGIALTARGKNKQEPIPLCGVPVHARDHYVNKLVKGGFKVAICDQLEAPRPGTVVRRGVTQVLTPGTLTDTKLLDEKSPSYLFSFFPAADQWGLLFGELLTAQLFATVIPASSEKMLETELIRFFPDEILMPANKEAKQFQTYFKRQGYFTTLLADDSEEKSEKKEMNDWLHAQFRTAVIDAVKKQEALYWALYYFYAYVRRNQQHALSQFHAMHLYKSDDFLLLDSATQRNLELVGNMRDGGRNNTIFAIMDGAQTAMGSRMIKKWILRPLIKKEAIIQRQDVIGFLMDNIVCAQELKNLLRQIGDIERIIGRIGLKRASIHDYQSLAASLAVIPLIRELLQKNQLICLFTIMHAHIADFSLLATLLENAINNDTSKEWIIKPRFDERLDNLRELVHNSNKKIIELERKEQKETGIRSLKVRYNQIQGYFIEVTKANRHLVPDYYQRQQTLVGKERFLTTDLRQLQYEIERAKQEINAVEQSVFEIVKEQVFSAIIPLRKCAHALANLDALVGLSAVAYNNNYVRPELNNNRLIIIENGRHPVVEAVLEHNFITNNTTLDSEQSLWIITGPNMGGKSTYLRQVALICIMAQVGSFVPAQKAQIAILDRLFTRIGAGDNLAEGKSTFLVEMEETATICTQATKNSLIILDEVGRGTSTFDGLAIAHAVVEYLYTVVQARCLFATHYHELTQLQQEFPGIASYYAASKKTEQGIVFLYKIIKGVADGSFGIEVAKLAQLPSVIIKRSHELVNNLAVISHNRIDQPDKEASLQQAYVELTHENKQMHATISKLQQQAEATEVLRGALQAVDYDNLSPKQAFDLLWRLKEGIF
ncbi:MAG TPA: DNA mismatch repair protein MutS [Candidatus Dependentiae bacterium]|nr:DNA mismatch repair protein MutS [Candidatus Dependentiae bacterium]